MIEGLKLKVSSQELRDHCIRRAAYHQTRAADKLTSLPELERSLEMIKGATTASAERLSNMGGKNSYHLDADDPVKDLERDIQDHGNKVLVFEFFATHLFDEDYTLKEDDLIRLEILRR